MAEERSAAGLVVRFTREVDSVLAALTGELDAASAPSLREALAPLLDPPPHRLVFDLAGLDFMDSSGVNEMVFLHRLLGEEGSLVFRRPGLPVRRLLELTSVVRLPRVEFDPAA